jgi:hypothetical protein
METMAIIAMWAHSRSVSTAFLRMMIERGDVIVVHEPWLALTETGQVALPEPDGGQSVVRSDDELCDHLLRLGESRSVFIKEVLDYRYPFLYEKPERLASFTHTFIARHPRQTIASHYALKATVSSQEIGFERLFELFELCWSSSKRRPLVIRSEQLLSDPAVVAERFCDYTGLPFMPQSLNWEPTDRHEWGRHRAWHLDVINSSGFSPRENNYESTIDNNETLKSFYDHHYPFYEKLLQYAD